MVVFVVVGGRSRGAGFVETSPEMAEFRGPLGDYSIHLPWRIPGLLTLGFREARRENVVLDMLNAWDCEELRNKKKEDDDDDDQEEEGV